MGIDVSKHNIYDRMTHSKGVSVCRINNGAISETRVTGILTRAKLACDTPSLK